MGEVFDDVGGFIEDSFDWGMNTVGDIANTITSPIADIAESIPGGNVLVPAALSLMNPYLGASYVGARNAIDSGNPLLGALSAGGSFLGSEYLGPEIAENIVPAGVANTLGSSATNALSSGIGSFIGSQGANIAAESLGVGPVSPEATKLERWEPSLMSLGTVPSSLGGLSGGQATSNIATQAIYGGGVGEDESSYFKNLINNRLVENPSMSQISPIESSFLSQLGLGSYSDPYSLMKALEA